MKIEKVKKIDTLVKDDIVVISVEGQENAGLHSDLVDENMIAIVGEIAHDEQEGTVTILVNGGYKFTYDEDTIVFYLGNYEFVKNQASLLFKTFNGTFDSISNINKFISDAQEKAKSKLFVKTSVN